MPSTDIDGSPILILGRAQAEVIVDWARAWQSHLGPGFTEAQHEVLRRIAYTFPEMDVPGTKARSS